MGNGRQHVEYDEVRVHKCDARNERPGENTFHTVEIGQIAHAGYEPQNPRDDHVHGGPGQRHPQLLLRIVGHAVESRDATDGQQRDVTRADPVTTRSQCVAELMEHHAREERADEEHVLDRRGGAVSRLPAHQADPAEKQDERHVDVQRDAEQLSYAKRPFHVASI
jgi:autonomous glycyl radical cofactor GrcA